jgi:integrase
MDENLFQPENTPWKQNDRHIEFYGSYGERRLKHFKTTDISISATKQENPYDEWIDDGMKLRPLPQQEQVWLLDALISLKNYEMLLIHLFGLLTGARMQTILTFRVRDALKNHLIGSQNSLRYPVGPGTGIDTKNDKQLILHFPVWFYNMLSAYSVSARAKRRRLKAHGGDTEDQYLFLSVRGTPLYTSRHDETSTFLNSIRHRKIGQGVRQYITDYIIPFIQQKYDRRFHYRFHDTRATFGMNMVDERMKLVEEKKIPLADVMNFVQVRMGHASLATTERYLNYRSRQKLIHAAQDGWEAKLEQIARTEFEK